jgi:hypothetical protein
VFLLIEMVIDSLRIRLVSNLLQVPLAWIDYVLVYSARDFVMPGPSLNNHSEIVSCSICFNKWKIWQIQTIIDGINWNDVLQETKFEILPKISTYLHIINIHILKTV